MTDFLTPHTDEPSRISQVHSLHPSDGVSTRRKRLGRSLLIAVVMMVFLGVLGMLLVRYVQNGEYGNGGESLELLTPEERLEILERLSAQVEGEGTEPLSQTERLRLLGELDTAPSGADSLETGSDTTASSGMTGAESAPPAETDAKRQERLNLLEQLDQS